MTMTTHTFNLTIETPVESVDEVRELFYLLITSGQVDARETLDDPDMSEAHDDCNKALSLDISMTESEQ